MGTRKTTWTGLAVVVSAPRNRVRLRDRLTEMADGSKDNDLVFARPEIGVARTGGAHGSGAALSFTAANDDANRVPTDVARKIRGAMGDAEVVCHVVIFEAFA